jgi:diguanylate cyclase (GGDEF)-like protein
METDLPDEAALLSALVNDDPDPIVVLAEDGSTYWANPAAERRIGLARGGARIVDALGGENLIRWRSEVAGSVATTGSWRGNLSFRVGPDEELPLALSVQPISLGGRPFLGIVGRDRSVEARLEAELAERADHDGLTGCSTRRPLEEAVRRSLARLRRSDLSFSICFIDLDGFKTVNDVLGHEAGDTVLATVAERLRAEVRETDIVARIGGDEFVLLLSDVDDMTDPTLVAARVIARICQPIDVGSGVATVGASAGVYVARDPEDTPERVMRRADTAMYEAKRLGKGRVVVFGEELHQRAIDRLDLGAALRRATVEHQLDPVFRPVASVETDGVVALEASLWWRHPERGVLRLKDFVDVARDTGLIVDIDRWLVGEVCRFLTEWRRIAPDLGIWVTLSERLVLRDGFVDVLVEQVTEHEAARGGLGVELRTDALARYPREMADAMRELDAHGVLIALDDFGPAPCSPVDLHALPIHTVKLHRDLTVGLATSDAPSTALRAVVAMVEALGIQPQAKGVDGPDHLRRLADLGIEQMQGSLIGRHEPAAVTGILLTAARSAMTRIG